MAGSFLLLTSVGWLSPAQGIISPSPTQPCPASIWRTDGHRDVVSTWKLALLLAVPGNHRPPNMCPRSSRGRKKLPTGRASLSCGQAILESWNVALLVLTAATSPGGARLSCQAYGASLGGWLGLL